MALVASRMLTRDDLDALPDDGLRHELIDGSFVMTPARRDGASGLRLRPRQGFARDT
jgi:hypothetical protein